jgi:hypothetical protein
MRLESFCFWTNGAYKSGLSALDLTALLGVYLRVPNSIDTTIDGFIWVSCLYYVAQHIYRQLYVDPDTLVFQDIFDSTSCVADNSEGSGSDVPWAFDPLLEPNPLYSSHLDGLNAENSAFLNALPFVLDVSPGPLPSEQPYNFIEELNDDNTEQPTTSFPCENAITAPPVKPVNVLVPSAVQQMYEILKMQLAYTRTRRPGLNKYGRGGIPRCQRCRKHRQKVISTT